ncbi:hypothetical protein [Primorskyibacter sp. S87]
MSNVVGMDGKPVDLDQAADPIFPSPQPPVWPSIIAGFILGFVVVSLAI